MADVFDRSTGTSRYDPRDGELPTYRLVCPAESCRAENPYGWTAGFSHQRFTCSTCARPFTVYQGEVVSLEVEGSGVVTHYVLRCRDADGSERSFEFTDTSAARWSASPGGRVMLVHAAGGELRAVQDLTSGRFLWLPGKRGCFLATAVYGEGAPQLDRLRRFRDRTLVPHRSGRALVRTYYALSPPLALALERSPRVATGVRHALDLVLEHLP